MNFSFELSGALLTGNVNQEAMTAMSSLAAAMVGGLAMVRIVVVVCLAALMIISRWRIFSKAGLPGWGIFIPFYNRYLMFKLGGRSGRNFLWIILPPVFGVLMIINAFKIAEKFGKHWTYGLGILFLKIVFIPILAFDNSKYLGKKTGIQAIEKATSKPIPRTVAQAPIKKAPTKPTSKPTTKVTSKSPIKKIAAKPASTGVTKAPTKKVAPAKKKAPVKQVKILSKKK